MIRYRGFRQKKSYSLAAIIVLLALFFSVSTLRDLFGLRSFLISAIYPFQLTAAVVWKGILGVPPSILRLRDLSVENIELRKSLNNAAAKLSIMEELISENNRLRQALGFREGSRYRFDLLAARVVGRGAAPVFSILVINRGKAHGVRAGTPVIVKEGLVGKVFEVSQFSSKVMLIADPRCSVAVADERSRELGVVEGYSPEVVLMKFVSGNGDVKEGDMIITSSISSIFPPGIPVGTVSRVADRGTGIFLRIEVRPRASLTKLEEVFLVR